jgi:hypothetical protein
MVSSAATTVSQYLSSLPPPRRAEISRVRDLVNANLLAGYEEGILYGMISWFIPLAKKPDTTTASRCASPASARRRTTTRCT